MSGYQDVDISKEDLINAMRTDCVMSLSFYLGEELDLEVPLLHKEIWAEMVEMVREVNLNQWVGHMQKLFCVPRGFAKTTVIKVAIILFMRYSRLSFTMYASRTSPVAKAAIKDVYNWLCSPQDQFLHGPVEVHKANETDGLWIVTIGTPDFGRKRIILKALGSDTQIRGTNVESRRPDLQVFDDVEDNETALTEDSQRKLDIWLMGNAMKASARRSVKIILGNMINSRTMLYRFSKDKEWRPTVYGAIVRNKVTGRLESLWEAFFSLEALLKEYKDYRSKGVGHVWIYEMMNMTADTVFKTELADAIRIPRPLPDQVTAGIIILDPAFGQKAWNDESALTVHVKIKGSGIPHVVQSLKGRWTEEQILEMLLMLSIYWNIATWGIESVAAQKLLIPLFELMLTQRQYPKGLITMIGLPSGGVAKASRILAFAKSVGAQSYGIVEEEEEMFQEIENYDPMIDSSVVKDDRPDSAAYGVIAWAQAGEVILQDGKYSEKFALLRGVTEAEDVSQVDYVPM